MGEIDTGQTGVPPSRADARFLLVDDDLSLCRALARLVRRHSQVVVATSVGEARERLLEGGDWSGLIVDVELPDGSGLDLLAHARDQHPLTPALVLTGHTDAVLINRAFDLSADYVVKPVVAERLERFVKDAGSQQPRTSLLSRVERVAAALARACELTEAEEDVLRRSALGESRLEIAEARGSSEQTVRTHVARLLAKTGHGSLSSAAGWILRQAARVSE